MFRLPTTSSLPPPAAHPHSSPLCPRPLKKKKKKEELDNNNKRRVPSLQSAVITCKARATCTAGSERHALSTNHNLVPHAPRPRAALAEDVLSADERTDDLVDFRLQKSTGVYRLQAKDSLWGTKLSRGSLNGL